jgi:glycosyltransferase involved in cell wall biosynthesis
VRVLIVSNLDSERPFGQFVRPFCLGRGMARAGVEVAEVGVDCSRVDFGPAWSVGRQALGRLARATALARRTFRPDVIYAHQNTPGTAALVAAGGLPVAADFHSLPSVEWRSLAAAASGARSAGLRAKGARAAAVERLLARRSDLIVAAGQSLAEQIASRYGPVVETLVVANGVDHELLDAPRADASPYNGPGLAHALATLPMSSATSRRALEFLGDVASRLDELDAPVEVHVVGTDDGPRARALRYHGILPVLRPWLDHADVCLLPYPADAMHSGGSKNKFLEYLARGRRVVSTPEGVRGLEEAADWEGVEVVPFDAGAFADAIVEAGKPGAPALDESRTLVSTRYRWDVLAEELARALRRTLSAA